MEISHEWLGPKSHEQVNRNALYSPEQTNRNALYSPEQTNRNALYESLASILHQVGTILCLS